MSDVKCYLGMIALFTIGTWTYSAVGPTAGTCVMEAASWTEGTRTLTSATLASTHSHRFYILPLPLLPLIRSCISLVSHERACLLRTCL
jgi:hypothetical protein